MAKNGPLCHQFAATRTCKYGDRCSFSHDNTAAEDRSKTCPYFAKGTCRFGAGCKFSHAQSGSHVSTPASNSKPCPFFAKGTCRFGTACKFSHDAPSSRGISSPAEGSVAGADAPPSLQDTFVRWRFNIPRDDGATMVIRPLAGKSTSFIQQALALVEAGSDMMQQVINSLAGEGGLVRLGEFLNSDLNRMDDETLSRTFAERLLPFFSIVSHDSVLSSQLVEARRGTLLNYIYGVNGQRALALFRAAARGLASLDAMQTSYEPCIITLSAVFEINTSAQVNDDLKEIAETLLALYPDDNLCGHALRSTQKLKLRLGLGDAIQGRDQLAGNASILALPTFEITLDQPGRLSAQGPRHDNDTEHFQRIQILPTLGEIQSNRAEYLPRSDTSTWHKAGVQGLLDRHFRLVREDTVGPLRDAAKFELNRIQNSHANSTLARLRGARTHAYNNVVLVGAEFDGHKGLQFVLAFEQPAALRGKSLTQRIKWWTESKRLGPESLVVLLGGDGLAIFLTVATGTPPYRALEAEKAPIEERYSRWADPDFAYVVVQPVNSTGPDVETLLPCLGLANSRLANEVRFSLLEFPGVVLPAFQPTLKALQHMGRENLLPFAELLASTDASPTIKTIDLPAYARRDGFRFDLSAITTDKQPLLFHPQTPLAAEDLCARTTLDPAQGAAVAASLTRSLALIQGPPGTGKSYTGIALMKILLANKDVAKLGPIICVTYTNHALDQSLEHLVDAGVKQIIRIGSRSKSEKLVPLNLRVVAQKYDTTKMERQERWQSKQHMLASGENINGALENLISGTSDARVMAHLKTTATPYYTELSAGDLDKDGFTEVKHRASQGLSDWLKGDVRGHRRNGRAPTELMSMSRQRRRELYAEWIGDMTANAQEDVLAQLEAYHEAKTAQEKIRNEINLRVLSDANVVGLTTSGLARNIDMLRKLNAKVLLVEEAGEVLEAHLLTAMLPSIEHAILIGDHQQLRPKVQNYELSCENRTSLNKLDISMFERLVSPEDGAGGKLPYITLETQRRMHPSISNLIRTTMYPNLQDAGSVTRYPEVVGMRRRLFWLHHDKKEDAMHDHSDSASKTNQYEVDMVFALVRHLVRQGVYRPEDIAVLTPYLGQLRQLRQALGAFTEVVLNDRDIDDLDEGSGESEADVEDDHDVPKDVGSLLPRASVVKSTLLQALRLATVDNFQGEEAKVIIVSLVRSNDERKCGFLRTSNRINVLLSRAQHGMYIIGNTETSVHVDMWAQVLTLLKRGNNVGTELELCCPRHPQTPLRVKTPDDFPRVSPEAGCDLMCGKQLACGHSCINKCHSDGLHNAVHCTKPCTRSKAGCNHTCPYECGQQCDDKCQEVVARDDIILPCGHQIASLPCWQYQDRSKAKCMVLVQRTIPGCHHKVMLPCHVDPKDPSYICQVRCGALLACGHQCRDECRTCKLRHEGRITSENHGTCTQACGRDYTNCKHSCVAPCHGEEPCPSCPQPCDVQCSHSRCTKKCHEPCAPCAEDVCASRCPHSACAMPCAAPCDWVPCSKRCEKLLECGHQCPSICSAECPSEEYCQVCASDDVKQLRADMLEMMPYGEVDLAENPCLFLPCGHVFTVESLDGWMSMSDHYGMDGVTGMPVIIRGDSKPFSHDELKVCPDCRGSLRNIPRYGRIVRRALLDESTKKFIIWSHKHYIELAEQLSREVDTLRENRDNAKFPAGEFAIGQSGRPPTQVLHKIKALSGRYGRMGNLHNKMERFLRQVRQEEQPFMRVRDMVETARRRQLQETGTSINEFDFDQSEVVQTRGELLATSILIRCDIMVVSDLVNLWRQTMDNITEEALTLELSKTRQKCETLIEAAAQTRNLLQQTEGHIYWAHLAMLECNTMENQVNGEGDAKLQHIKVSAEHHLGEAESLCDKHPGQTKTVTHEVTEVRRMLVEGSYESQMRMVVAAMATEFTGTGHWYTCVNGHSFTVSECGMPMQQAHCPQCDAPIGGQNHRPADGVQHADAIERRFQNMRL